MDRNKQEIINLKNAFNRVKILVQEQRELEEKVIMELHKILMENIQPGGCYRSCPVYISDSSHDFPLPEELPFKLQTFYKNLSEKNWACGMPEGIHPIQLAAWTHLEFVNIHPYQDGNGRISRLMMNYVLMSNGWPPVSIPLNLKNQYYGILDQYYKMCDVVPMANFLGELVLEEMKGTERNIEILRVRNNREIYQDVAGLEP